MYPSTSTTMKFSHKNEIFKENLKRQTIKIKNNNAEDDSEKKKQNI